MTHLLRFGLALAIVSSALCAPAALAARAARPAPAAAAEAAEAMTADQAFDALKTWDDGQSHVSLAVLEQHVGRTSADAAARGKAAERLMAILADPKSPPSARKVAAHLLQVVASDAQVPALVKLLDDKGAADLARGVLETIPGEASAEALRAALARQKGDALAGVINSLGNRRDAESVAALAKFLKDADATVAAAAARALGKIGTADAAEVIGAVRYPPHLAAAAQDAALRCAEALAAAGNAPAAAAIYESLLEHSDLRPVWAAALDGLGTVRPQAALPLVVQALRSDDPLLRGTAANLAREMPGPAVTAALAAELEKLPAAGQAALVETLAARGDRAAGPAVQALFSAKDPAVVLAAVSALGVLGGEDSVQPLCRAADAWPNVQAAARTALARLDAPGVDARLLDLAARHDGGAQAEAVRALGARRTAGAGRVLLEAVDNGDERVSAAALEALAAAGGPDTYGRLVQRLAAAGSANHPEEIAQAVAAVGSRISAPAERAAPVLLALATAPAAAKPALLRVLAAGGGPQALEAVRGYLKDNDAAVREAAVRALAAWPDEAAAADLLSLARDAERPALKALAMRGYLRLASAAKDEAARTKLLSQVRPIATTVEAKKMLLAALGDTPSAAALAAAMEFVGDKDVQAEAAAAALRIARALARSDRPAVQAAMKKLADATPDPAVRQQAGAVLAAAPKGRPAAAGSAEVPAPSKERGEALKKELAKRAPQGYRLACYLDCGPDAEDGRPGGPMLSVLSGAKYLWGGADKAADIRFGTVFFDGQEVVFEATGLSPRRTYQLGFSWWDYDHDARAQSVWAAPGRTGKYVKLLDKTALPSFQGRGEKPAEKTVAVPREVTAGGSMRIAFRNEAAPNVVVSELWLWESEAETAAPPPASADAAAPATAAAPAAGKSAVPPASAESGPQEAPRGSPDFKLKPGKAEPGRTTRILIVTGQEHPAHPWRQTAPVLAEELSKDPRLLVDVSEDAGILASPRIADYATIVLHFMNPKPFDLGAKGRENLRRYVEGGRGFMLVHFACGAFQEWPEFRDLVARVWDPKLRGHDPRGPFRVEITAADHPITRGLKAFDADDELYTCLVGERPIEVLATARSKVDQKEYPMAFVYAPGKGRVFQCMLGHDVKAMRMPGVGDLYRRGCAWAAGL